MQKPVPKACRRRLQTALLLFPLIWLTGCASSGDAIPPRLPDAPPGLTACTDEAVPGLPGAAGTGWDSAQAVGIIGDQRRSALAKDRCARDWRAFYGDLRVKLGAQ